ncbi:MAG: hypothetical protein LBV57_05385, partial [Candidatus Symbiothrix sp.]|nr:hypothetical protein [Candidatus Symbiothrix sp.]
HVVEQGVDTVVLPRQEVVVRNDYFYYIKDYITGDTLHNEVPSLFSPMSFVFGIPESYVADKAGLACVGWAIPLSSQYKLKKGAIIDLIIPSVSGNSSDNAAFRPVFYKHLQYSDFGPIDIAI